MPVVQDARAGRLRRRFGAAAIAAIIVVTQATAVALAAPPGTSLTATKTMTGHLVRTFPWTLSKTVDPSSLTLSSGESGDVTYTVGATKGSAVQSAFFDGQVCVTNTGVVATQDLAITDAISKPPSKAVLASAPVSVSAHPVLQPGETFCYPYRVDIFSGVTPGATYKDTASVTISNKASGKSGPAPSATAILPTTVEVTNNDSITVADTNGSSFTFTATGTETYDTTFTCPGDDGSHENTVSATGFVSTPSVLEPAPESATVDVTCLEPDVRVSKDDGLSSATLGDTITYAMSVSNIGLGAAHGVMLSDSLPAGITWSIDNTTDFALSGSSLTLANEPIDLAAGATLTVNVSGTVTQDVCETTLTNSASVSATNEDAANTDNNSATDTTAIGCVQLEVTKTADAASVSAGDAVGYMIAVSNSGAGSASGVTLTDTLPTDAGLSWTISPPDADCSISTGTLTCNFGTIAAAGSASVHITSPTTPETCGTISNEASATTTSAPGTAASGAVIIVVNCPDVTVSKTADASPISAGDTAAFTIVVSNDGAGTGHGVTLSDTLPTGIAWTDDSADCDIVGGILTCDFGDQVPGPIATIHLTGTTAAADCGTLDNTATASATNEATANQANNSSTATITVSCPDVTVSKAPDAGTIDGGDEAAYTITVTNVGAATATDVTLSDTLPTNGGLTWAIDAGNSDTGCSISAGTLSCAFGSLAPAASKHVHITSPTTFATCGTIDNTATAAASNEAAADQGNNSSSAQIAVNCADVEIAKAADDDTVNAGDPIGFEITVTNVGTGTATDVSVADTLPSNAGLDWSIDVPGSDSGCTIDAGQLSCSFGDIGSGASKHVHITSPTTAAICGAADASALVANTVSVSLTNGPDGETSASITVACPNDPPVNTVPGAQSVDEDTDLVFSAANSNAISVADPDAGAGNVQVTVLVLNGTVTPALGSGATVAGSGTSSTTITGTLTQVNAALDGLKYKGNLNFNVTRGDETLTITTDDLGNSGFGGSMTDMDPVDITVNAVNDAPSAVAKNYNAQANMKIVGLSGLLTGATDPDTGDSGYSAVFTVGTVSATTPAGGTISNLNMANGTFDFDPPPGATGNVTFTFTVCDSGNPAPSACSAPATVTVTVAGPVIWFVNPAAGVNGDGRLSSPFNTLASAAAVDAAGHRIFLYTGTATTGITLNTDEWLIGQGVTGSGGTPFDTLFGITPPTGTIARPTLSGTRPVVQGNVAMATSDAVRGLNIQPASGTAGLTATSATSLTVGEVSVTTVNAAAVNLSSAGGTIGLTSVSANGGSNGIVLNNTTGSFTVTGSGGTCTEANTSGCSGGTIQNMTGGDDSSATPVGTGIVLNNAAGVSLTRMYIHDHTNYGIRGTGVAGFALDTSVVNGVNGTNVASPYSDGSISFDNLSGTSAITNTAVAGGYQRNIRVDNTTGTLTLTINNNSIHNTGAAFGDDGLFVEIGGGTATLTVTNNTFAAHGGDHFNLSLLGTPTVALTFTGNFWTGGHVIGLGQGLFILAAIFDGTFTYDILNNGTVANPLVGNRQGGAMHVNKGSGTGSFSGTISNNVIGNPAVDGSGSSEASGIDVEAHGAGGSHTTLITNNLVRQFHNDGILLIAGEGNAALNATVTGNTVSNPDASTASLHGMHFNTGTLVTDAGSHCLDVKNNTLTGAGADGDNGTPNNAGVDLRMRQRQLTTVRLPGYGGANNDNTAVQTFLTGTNANAVTTILASNSLLTFPAAGGFVGGAACAQP